MNRLKEHSQNPPTRPLILIVVGLLLMIGAVIWIVLNPGQPKAAAVRPTFTTDPNGPFPNIPRVSLEDAKKAFDEKTAVFVDVRSADAYNAAHIPGAVNIPLAELDSRAGELNPADWIITYCT